MSVSRYTLLKVTGSETISDLSYQVEYLVTVTSPQDHTYTILSEMPWKVGDEFSIGNDYDPRAIALTASAEPVPSNHFKWIYKVEFGKPPKDQETDNPLDQPPVLELIFAQEEKLLEQDVNGKAIRNSVGDRFDDVLTREDSQPVLRITRNEPRASALFGMDLRDTVNRSPWMGAPRRTIKFQPPTLRSRFHKNIGVYYEKGYEFKFSDETWRFVLLNQGYYEKDADSSDNTKRKRITVKGEPIQQPVALTEEGLLLPEDEDPVWLEFDGYRESMFPPSLAVSL